MKKRNPLLVLLFTIITLGIYSIFWLYYTRKEMNGALKDPKAIPPMLLLCLPWLIMLAAVLFGVALDAVMQQNHGVMVVLGLLIIVPLLAGFIYPFFWFYNYSVAVHRLVPETDTAQIYVLWIVLMLFSVGFVWPLLVQVELNKWIDRQGGATPPPQSAGAGQSLHEPTPAHHASAHHASRTAQSHRDESPLPPSPSEG